MRPKSAVFGRARALPKIHKPYEVLPKFRPIIDTIDTPDYKIGKFLANLLQPLTINQYSVKDSFAAAERIKSIKPELFDNGYKFVSFDVTSLFTNVPLTKTINVILDRIYNHKLLETRLKKRTLKKLILDTCQKTIFSANGQLYQQIDGVSMGACLGPVLANIIMTEHEKVIVDRLIADGTIAFYARYVDDTLLLIKPEKVDYVLQQFNSYHTDLQFTLDTFIDNKIHFLDLHIINNNQIDIYRKESFTGQYSRFDSFEPWSFRIGWIRSIYSRIEKLCSTTKSKTKQLSSLDKLMGYNGFPKYVRKSILSKFRKVKTHTNSSSDIDDTPTIWFNLPFLGTEGEHLVKKCVRRLKHNFRTCVKIKVHYKTHKMAMFCGLKDKVPSNLQSHVIYEFCCPGCHSKYIGKTDRNFGTRLDEHGSINNDQTSAISSHLLSCTHFHEMVSLINIGNSDDSINVQSHVLEAVRKHTNIVARNDNWVQLCFLETLFYKRNSPSLNDGLKAMKTFKLFT